MALAALKAISARSTRCSDVWDEFARDPGTAWTMLRVYLAGAGVGGTFLALVLTAPLLATQTLPFGIRVVQYSLLAAALVCAAVGEVQAASRAAAWDRRPGRKLFADPQFDADLVRNRDILMASSRIGLVLAILAGFAVAAWNPLHQ